jgi:very-short-patch-repair endonuclease
MPRLDTRRPFTSAQALAAGITQAMLRGPRFTPLFRGVYIAAQKRPSDEIRIHAALLVVPPDAFVSHHSAAKLYSLPVPSSPLVHVSVIATRDRRKRDGIVTHLAAVQPLRHVRGVPVSTPTQLFIDLASTLNLLDLVVLGDAIVRKKLATVDEIVAACAAWEGRHARAARRAAGYVRANVDSPMESRLRMLIVLAGLPEPKVNLELRDQFDLLVYKLDLSYPHLKIAIEYDGQQHRQDLPQWNHDINRGEWLERNQWRVIPVISTGIYRHPDQTIERVLVALKARGCQNLPRVLSDEWRLYFPMR